MNPDLGQALWDRDGGETAQTVVGVGFDVVVDYGAFFPLPFPRVLGHLKGEAMAASG
jgi:hypothetical protein